MRKGIFTDWWIVAACLPIFAAGLSTMYSFSGDNSFADHQIIWIAVSLIVFFIVSSIDLRFLRNTWVSVTLFVISVLLLGSLFFLGKISHGAVNWLSFGLVSFQPSEFAKLSLIVILAKYFSRRHIEIANIRHIIVSGAYALVFFLLVLMLPDLGSGIIIGILWLAMILVSGISKKHLFAMMAIGAVTAIILWSFVFQEYQKARIRAFVNPNLDIHATGYNAYQSTIAVGSGQLLGKGLGYGTQSRLKFLPEYQTDFIFAAFAEEWGVVGITILLGLFAIIIWRILVHTMRGDTNFEILFGLGAAIYFIVHVSINIAMNMRLLPVTGTPLPLMSYGGTHIMSEMLLLGVVIAMRRYARSAHKDATKHEFLGIDTSI